MKTASNTHPPQGPAAPGSRFLTQQTLGLGFVSILAFLAVALLAGQRGETTPTTPAFLAKTLGPSVPTARPAGRPAPGVAVRFRRDGLAVSRSGSTLRLGVVGPAASPWAGFVNGVSRRTSFGLETVTYDPGVVEQFLTVTERQGPKTWRWRLRGAEPRLRADGSVALSRAGLAIAPAAVLDAAGRAVTPAGARWSVRRRTGGWLLELEFDDAGLSLPYVIDPAVTWRASSSDNNAGGALTLTINKPAGTVQNDLLLAHLSVRGGAAATINAPVGWSLVRRTNNATAPGLAQAVYTKVAGGSESASYQWGFDSARRAAGGITGYYGVNDSNIVDVWSENTGSGKNAQANTITTTGPNHRLVGLYGSSASTSFAPPAGTSELYDTNSTGATAEAADTTQVAAGATGNKLSVAANNGSWVAQLVALRLDAASPTAPAPTVSESSADSHVTGSTFYYRPGGGGGSFTVADTATDGGSGLAKVTFPGMAAGAGITPTSSLDVAFPGPYTRTYTWTTGSSDSGAKTVTAVDNAGNSASTTFTVTADSGAPTAQTISLPGGPYLNTLSVPYTTGDGADALSGLDTTTRLVERATAALAGDGCGTFGSFAPAPASPDTTVVAGNCYRYRFTVRDNVGNLSAAVTADAKIDTGSPGVSFTAPVEVGNPGAQYYDSTSKTHYFRPGASGSFTLTASASDAETAVAQVGFPDLSAVSGWSGSTGGSDTTAPYASPVDYSWSSGAAAPGARSVSATDRAGNTASAGFTLTADSTAPSGQTIVLTGAGAPWYTSPSVTFSLAGGADSGSGLDPSSQIVTRETGTLSGGSCSGFVADGGSYSTPDASVAGDRCYRYAFVESDRVGNQATEMNAVAKVDTTAPGAVMADPGANVRGTVSLGSTTGDSGSGLASSSYEYRPAGGGSWTATPAAWDTLVIADGLYGLRVIAVDNAGNQTVSPAVTTRVDNTDPFTSDDAPGGYRSTPVTITLTPADSGSGVAETEYSVDAGPFQSGTSVFISAPGDHSNDGTHTIRYRSTDLAGNVEALRTATARIDTTPPGGGSGDPGQYFRGTVALTAAPSDSGAGIDSVVFQRSPAGLGSWTTIATDFSDPYDVDWDTTAAADGSYDLRFLFRDGATNESVSTLSNRVVDNAVPGGALTAPADGAFVAGAVALTADASDATSGVALVAFQVKASGAAAFATVDTDSTAPYTTSWDSTVAPDGPAEMRVVVTDRAGNTAPSATATVTVDNLAPVITLDDPGANVRGTVVLAGTSSADNAQVVFQRRPASGGGWTTIGTDLTTPFTSSFDTTAVADGSYELRAVATDLSLNQGSSAVRTMRVDNTDPTGSLDTPVSAATVGGPAVVLAATAADGGSGVASVLFQYRTPTGSWTDVAADSTDPYAAAWDTTVLSDGPYFLRAVVSDAAGNSAAPPQVPVTVDSTAPTVTLDDPGSPLSGIAPLSASASADTARVVFERRSAGGGAWAEIADDNSTPFAASFDTTGLPDGLYDLRATASDSLGNSSSDTRSSLRVDNTAPLLVASGPADGAVVGSADSISLTADETLASLSSVLLDGAPLPPPALSGATAELDTGDLADGPHTLWATLHDLAGQTSIVLLHFTVWNVGAGDFPYVEKNDPVAVGTTLLAVGGGARVTVPADATLLSGGDWLVLRVDPGPAAGAAAGFEGAGDTFDVSLHWALGGGSVHAFDRPLRITIPASGAVLPATYESGAWRLLPRVPTAGSLPPGWSDGYYVDGSEIQILTLHLSRFALLRDVEAPTPPDRFAGSVSAGTLILSWAPGTDNSGSVDHFAVYVDGSLHATYGSAARSAGLGAFTSADARAFSISESDAAGNESGRTHRLRALPDLAGLTEAQARAALKARGFHAGSVERTSSATVAAGLVIAGLGSVRLAEEGTTVDFTVSAGSAPLPFDFTVLAPGRFSWARASSFTVRVSVSRAAAVAGRLVSPRGKTLRTWRISVKAGSSSSGLTMPASARREGRYSIRWAAKAGSAMLGRTTYLRVSGKSGYAAAVPLSSAPAGPSERGPYPLGSPPNGAHLRFRDERAGLSGLAAPVLPSGGGAGEAIPADSRASRGVLALLVALALALLLGALALSVFHPQVPRRHRLEW